MPYEGHCNCGSIRLVLKQNDQPLNSLVCYCRNCTRSGGGYSVNYAVDEASFHIQDPESALKTYDDRNTDSGNQVERQFCGKCGSAILTNSPNFPGKSIVKASLFDDMASPAMEVFTARRAAWQTAIQGAQQK